MTAQPMQVTISSVSFFRFLFHFIQYEVLDEIRNGDFCVGDIRDNASLLVEWRIINAKGCCGGGGKSSGEGRDPSGAR